ncbi:MAG: hypothetical protein PHS31_05165 [Victivallaceae bacterium]|nr:hypothetical protein [Victivallaceae bacterium]
MEWNYKTTQSVIDKTEYLIEILANMSESLSDAEITNFKSQLERAIRKIEALLHFV